LPGNTFPATATDNALTIDHFPAMKSPMVLLIARTEILARAPIRAEASLRAFNSYPHACAAP
jgi:hypothetical protein